MPRAKKTIDEHKANGTYRPSRHGKPPAAPAVSALDVSPPASVPAGLHAEWLAIVDDLKTAGTVTRTDLCLLERAFTQLGNAIKLQAVFDQSLTDPEASPSDVTKYQGATASATSSFQRLVTEIRRAVKANSRPQEKDEFAEWVS
jgi:hypothetical protein